MKPGGSALIIGIKPKPGGPPPPPPGMKDAPGHMGMSDDKPDDMAPEDGDEPDDDDTPMSPEDCLRKMRDMIDKCLGESDDKDPEESDAESMHGQDEPDDSRYGPQA